VLNFVLKSFSDDMPRVLSQGLAFFINKVY
jgi:hypothetical protein